MVQADRRLPALPNEKTTGSVAHPVVNPKKPNENNLLLFNDGTNIYLQPGGIVSNRWGGKNCR